MTELQMVWGWQPALYLFFGGMGAGAAVMATVLFYLDKKSHEKTVCASFWMAAICLALGLVFLLTELTNPLRGLMLWQSFSNFSSWMTIGAWIIFVALIVFVLAALVSTEKLIAVLQKNHRKFADTAVSSRKAFMILGLIFGLGVAIYTGILLMAAPGVPLWNTILLPILFTVSALDTGVALVEIIAVVNVKKEKLTQKAQKTIAYSVIVLVIVELCVLVLFALVMVSGNGLSAGAAQTASVSISLLLTGELAPFFWILVVVCGLVTPLTAAFVGLRQHTGKRIEATKSVDTQNDKFLQAEDTEPTKVDKTGPIDTDECEPAKEGGMSFEEAKTEVTNTQKPREEQSAKRDAGSLIGAIGTLIGGCALRFLILMAGLHADYIATTTYEIIKEIILTKLW